MAKVLRTGWPLLALAVFAATLLLSEAGYLNHLEHRAADIRARLLQHTVASDIVIVGIDARSLADLQQWPWPRRYHAKLLQRLAEAQPRQVLVDIDFSSHSSNDEDAALEAALAQFTHGQLILPTFFQQSEGAASAGFTRPLDRFARSARLAGVNFPLGEDSLVRQFKTAWNVPDGTLPAAAALLARAGPHDPAARVIDFSISPASFEFISYVDLLAGRVDSKELRDKTVLVGATATELNDMLPVPVYRWQPGVVVQALAAQTLREGALSTPARWKQVGALAALAAVLSLLFLQLSWRRNLLLLGAAIAALAALDLYLYSSLRIAIDVVPTAVLAVLAFLAATIRSLDDQTVRAISYSLGIRRRDAMLQSIVESSADCIVSIDARGAVQTANAAASRLFDCAHELLIGAPIDRFIGGLAPTLHPYEALIGRAGLVSEAQAITAHGRRVPVELSVSKAQVSDEILHTVIVRDISERKLQQRRLQHQATHDSLTGLPNRAAFTAHVETLLREAGPDVAFAVLMLDLCRFKEVNDTLGHAVGDRVLQEVARRFGTISAPAFVARIGGDEFALVTRSIEYQALLDIGARLHECLRKPIEIAGVGVDLGVSIGVAVCPLHARHADTLLKHADVAMYVSKRRGSSHEIYDASYDRHSVRRLTMVSELRLAIAAGDLKLHYQPQIDLRSGRAESVEALLRWHHRELGAVSPAEFIEVAESTDLIQPLTEWTLRTALMQAVQWRAQGLEPRLAVNLSARILQDLDFPQRLRALLDATAAPPASLELEITESAMMQDPERALRVIREIHALGVLMSIDDFGTGFSSLAYLRDLPVHALKLDRSFVLRMESSDSDRIIVDSTVQMAHALQLRVVAEGVETAWSAEYLKAAGYDYAQGFIYSKALSAHHCREWIIAFNAQSKAASAHPRERMAG